MKSREQLDKETFTELLINIQKCPHVDTGGQGHHMSRARRLCGKLGISPTSEKLKIISDDYKDFENVRMTAVREAQRPRIKILKERVSKFR